MFSARVDTGTPAEGTVALALDRVAVGELTWVNAGPVVRGASVYVVSEDTGAPELPRVDPATGRVTARIPVPMGAVLLGGDMEPLVVVAGEATQAWALVGDTLVERSAFPAMDWVGGGVVVGGVAFVVGRDPDEDDARLVRVDLTTGEADTIEVPAGIDVWRSPPARVGAPSATRRRWSGCCAPLPSRLGRGVPARWRPFWSRVGRPPPPGRGGSVPSRLAAEPLGPPRRRRCRVAVPPGPPAERAPAGHLARRTSRRAGWREPPASPTAERANARFSPAPPPRPAPRPAGPGTRQYGRQCGS
ncbi:MAG: hypothetical protein V4850_04335 [Myxococcota bacterium]